MRAQITLLRAYLGPQWLKVGFLVVLLATTIALELLVPLWLARFIDQAVAGQGLAVLQATAIIFLAMALGRQVVVGAAGYLSEDVSWTATNRLREDLTAHCLELDMAFHKAYRPGELIERVDGDVTTLATFFSSFVFDVLGRALLIVGIVALTIALDYRLGFTLVVFAVLAVLVLRRIQGVAVPHFAALRAIRSDLAGFFEERLNSTEDLAANGARRYTIGQLDGLLDRFRRVNRKASVTARYSSSVLEVAVSVAAAVVIAVGGYLMGKGSMTIGAVYLAYTYTSLLSMTLFRITRQLNQFQAAAAGLERIAELYAARSTVQDGSGGVLPSSALEVEFSGVSFQYETGRPILRDLSFTVPAGGTLGLVGRTGSGKTTIGRLIFRGYDASAGSVRLGGVDVRRLELAALRSRIGVVTQDVQLFQATVRENVTLFNDQISDGAILAAIGSLGLTSWYSSLSDGLDSVIDNDRAMSGGEAQLLAFTRVLLREPDVVILDEPSSRLDPATERLVDGAVARLLKGRTAIVIAHRLSTVQRLDNVLVLDQGDILAFGRPQDVLHGGTSAAALRAGELA
ncbi:ABC transporter ATP-binding protein [Micromonospora sp. NPDC051227]|uniref:ABC transporter ATP-binding protein n=1 Tax=Micromonospora sp. NPDC051227 TaxID=3364285 RepID=UPI0037A22243